MASGGYRRDDLTTCHTAAVAEHPTRDDIELCSGTFWAGDHHEALTWMRANAPVYWDGQVWGITRYDDVKAVSKDPATFSNAGGIRPDTGPLPMMIDMDDPAHLQRRMLVNKGFTPAGCGTASRWCDRPAPRSSTPSSSVRAVTS